MTSPSTNKQRPSAQAPSVSGEHHLNRTGQAKPPANAQPPSSAERGNNGNQKPNGTALTGQPQNRGQAQRNTPSREQNVGRSVAGGEQNANVNAKGQINLSSQQASHVHEALLSRGRAAHTHVSFSVNVGAVVPEEVRVYPLPREVVAVSPRFRRDEYVIVHDEIVIVEPRTKRIVEVIGPAYGGRAAAGRPSYSGLFLTRKQCEIIRRDILRRHPATEEVRATVGEAVPGNVEIAPIPETVVAQVPVVRSYGYVVTPRDRILLVNPRTHDVAAMID